MRVCETCSRVCTKVSNVIYKQKLVSNVTWEQKKVRYGYLQTVMLALSQLFNMTRKNA